MKSKFILFLSMLLVSNGLYASESYKKLLSMYENKVKPPKVRMHVIDPYQVEMNKQYKIYALKAEKACKHLKDKSMTVIMKCEDKTWKIFEEKYPTRGTSDFSEKFYSKLSKAQAEKELDKLLYFIRVVAWRHKSYEEDENGRRIENELLIDQVQRDIEYIEEYILGRPPQDYRGF